MIDRYHYWQCRGDTWTCPDQTFSFAAINELYVY